MKKRSIKLYIPIFTKKSCKYKEGYIENKMTLLLANNFKELVPFLPCEEALMTHIQIEKINIQKDENYQPKPLNLSIKASIFNELKEKIKGINDHIPLVVGGSSIPICLIIPNKE